MVVGAAEVVLGAVDVLEDLPATFVKKMETEKFWWLALRLVLVMFVGSYWGSYPVPGVYSDGLRVVESLERTVGEHWMIFALDILLAVRFHQKVIGVWNPPMAILVGLHEVF